MLAGLGFEVEGFRVWSLGFMVCIQCKASLLANPLNGGFLALCFIRSSQHSTAEMDSCGVVGPRGRETKVPNNNSPLAPCQGCSQFAVGH